MTEEDIEQQAEKNESNNFIDQLGLIIDEAKTVVSKSPKVSAIQNFAKGLVEDFFYGNVIINFKYNLNKENMEELNISDKDVKNVEKKFNVLFKRCKLVLEGEFPDEMKNKSNDKKIDLKEYNNFKKELKRISENSYKLMLELEKHMDVALCQNRINEFNKEIKNLGKDLKIGNLSSEGDSLSISVGFDGDTDEDSNFDDEITDFNNFSIDIEDDYEEEFDFTDKNITLEDANGQFYGSYNLSLNKRYIIAYNDGYFDGGTLVGGPVYLIDNDNNKILWKKILERPNEAFVTDRGEAIIIDIVSSDRPVGKLYIFNKQGKKIFEHKFNSNIGSHGISQDSEELIIVTSFPEAAIYLFDVERTKLIKKVEDKTNNEFLMKFDFNKIKEFINNSPKFDQKTYDIQKNIQKKKEETELEEALERIKSLKKKNIQELEYDELVTVASDYAGDFYDNFGDPKKALRYIMLAIEIKNDKPQPYVLKLAGFCYEKLEKYSEAIKYYNWSIERYPQYKKSVVTDHINFCDLKQNNSYKKDWTSYIISERAKDRK